MNNDYLRIPKNIQNSQIVHNDVDNINTKTVNLIATGTTSIIGPFLLNDIDTTSLQPLYIAKSVASELNLGASDIITTVNGTFNSVGATNLSTASGITTIGSSNQVSISASGAIDGTVLTFGGSTATSLDLGKAGITTTILGKTDSDGSNLKNFLVKDSTNTGLNPSAPNGEVMYVDTGATPSTVLFSRLTVDHTDARAIQVRVKNNGTKVFTVRTDTTPGEVNIIGDLDINGISTLGQTNATNIDASGTLEVDGTSTLGQTNATNIDASGTLEVDGKTTLNGQLEVLGNITRISAGALLIGGNFATSIDLGAGVVNLTKNGNYNYINCGNFGIGGGQPNTGTRSFGTKLVVFDTLGSVQTDVAIGYETNYMWFSVQGLLNSLGFKFYGGGTEVARITGDGIIKAPDFDTLAAGPMTIGESSATSLTLAKAGVKTNILGDLDVTGILQPSCHFGTSNANPFSTTTTRVRFQLYETYGSIDGDASWVSISSVAGTSAITLNKIGVYEIKMSFGTESGATPIACKWRRIDFVSSSGPTTLTSQQGGFLPLTSGYRTSINISAIINHTNITHTYYFQSLSETNDTSFIQTSAVWGFGIIKKL